MVNSIMETFYRRWAEETLKKYVKLMRVVCVLGARQSGKSTMLENAQIKALYRTLDDENELLASQDTEFYLKQFSEDTVIIDEIQRAPNLILGIKRIVDKNSQPGQFVLTGSADYRKIPNATESLAGRAAVIRMRPLSQAEIRGVSPNFLQKLFSESFSPNDRVEALGKMKLFDLMLRGGFPEVQHFPREHLSVWFSMYIQNQIMRDLSLSSTIRVKPNTVLQALQAMAFFSCAIKNVGELAQETLVSRDTMDKYCSGMETLFLLDEIPAWTFNPIAGLRKKPKLVMADSGLVCHLLNIRHAETLLKGTTLQEQQFGRLVETWVYGQIAPEMDTHTDWRLFHYRANEDAEVDFLVENDRGELLGLEVKSRETLKPDDFKGLKKFKEAFKGTKFIGVVLYPGDKIFRQADGFWAIPMSAMWSS